MRPSRVAEFKSGPAGIAKIQFPACEETLSAINEIGDGYLPFVKYLTPRHQRLRAHREGMVDSLIRLRHVFHRLLALAQQDVVVLNKD